MIIDVILDRMTGCAYSTREFIACLADPIIAVADANAIRTALEAKNEVKTKRALCKYITNQGYPRCIKKYIRRVEWIKD